jgi:hypothetical protein
MDKGENGMQIILVVLPDSNLGPLDNKYNTLLQDPHRFTTSMQLKSYDGREGQDMIAWQHRKVTYGRQDKGENGTHFMLVVKSLNPRSNKQTRYEAFCSSDPKFPCRFYHEGRVHGMVARQSSRGKKQMIVVTNGYQDKGENGTHFILVLKSLNPRSNKQTNKRGIMPFAPQIQNSHAGSTTRAGHMVARQSSRGK